MTKPTSEEISTVINQALAGAPIQPEDNSVDSERFCMDDFRTDHDLEMIKPIAKLLCKLRGKKIETLEWVTTYEPGAMRHTGFFRIKVS